MEAIELAKEITDEIFSTSSGDVVTHLTLRDAAGRDRGGWCREAVLRTVMEKLSGPAPATLKEAPCPPR